MSIYTYTLMDVISFGAILASFRSQRKLMQNFGYSEAASKEDAMMVDAYCFVFSGNQKGRDDKEHKHFNSLKSWFNMQND